MIAKYEKIRQLYMERLAGMFSEEDELHFQSLLNTDPEAQAIVEELKKDQNHIDVQCFIEQTNENEELAKLKLTLNKNRHRRHLKPWLIAASIAGIFIFGILLYSKQYLIIQGNNKATHEVSKSQSVSLKLGNGEFVELSNKSTTDDTIAIGEMRLLTNANALRGAEGAVSSTMNVLTVPSKKDYMIVLSDGTKVWLNSESTLTFPFKFAGGKREVIVEGEAYFDVAKDKYRPFVVRTKQTSIEVIGTRFNVNTYNQHLVKTSLVEGRVNLTSHKGDEISLKPGFESQFNSDKGFVVKEFNQENVLSWINGVYYLQNTPLGSLTGLISRWFEVDIVFDNPELKAYQITGLLEKEHLSDFLKDLETSANIEYYYSGNRLHIK